MFNSLSSKSNKKTLVLLLTIIFLIILLRLLTLFPTFDRLDRSCIYRIGLTPINDAADWIERSLEILEGKTINMRALFPASLMPFVFNSVNMNHLVFLMISINILAVVAAFLILKDIRNNFFIVAFLAFIASWRILFLGSILTENLAAAFLLIAFALIIRGLLTSSFNYLAYGYLFIGMAQSVRPWDFISIFTLPLMCFFLKPYWRQKIKLYFVLLCIMLLGLSFNFLSSALFSNSQQANLDTANHIYGQVNGGKGDLYWITDRELKKAAISSSLKERTEMTYKKSFKILRQKPSLFIKGALRSIKWYFLKAHLAFKSSYLHFNFFTLFLILFFLYFYESAFYKFRAIFQKTNTVKIIIISLLVLLGSWNKFYFFIALLFLSLIFFFYAKNKILWFFSFLYILGILLSLTLIGASGFNRMWMASELSLYILCSISLFMLVETKIIPSLDTGFKTNYQILGKNLFLIVFCLSCYFIFLPLILRSNYNKKPEYFHTEISSRRITQELGITQEIISPQMIERLILTWPQPSFEAVDGSFVWFKTVYRGYKALMLHENEGYEQPIFLWHLFPQEFPRVVYDYRKPIIFSRVDKHKLSRFNNKEIIVVGKIIGKRRPKLVSRGFAIYAALIGYPDKKGNIEWTTLKDL